VLCHALSDATGNVTLNPDTRERTMTSVKATHNLPA
jgi:hypothetical protein